MTPKSPDAEELDGILDCHRARCPQWFTARILKPRVLTYQRQGPVVEQWSGWACRNQSCDAKLIVEKVTATGATVIHGFAYRMRPEGDLEYFTRVPHGTPIGGVLSKRQVVE
jgi:hypothetical protein